MSIFKDWSAYAAAVIARLKVLAPYALIELVLPGGSVMALLLWLYRRRKSEAHAGQLSVKLPAFLRLADLEPLPGSDTGSRKGLLLRERLG